MHILDGVQAGVAWQQHPHTPLPFFVAGESNVAEEEKPEDEEKPAESTVVQKQKTMFEHIDKSSLLMTTVLSLASVQCGF